MLHRIVPCSAAVLLTAGLSAQTLLPPGPSIGGGLDVVVTQALPFTFFFPDGTAATSIDIDGHGRIAPGGTFTSADFSPTVAELLAGPSTICPLWTDLDDANGGADQIHFNASGGIAVVTWLDVEASFGAAIPFTVQLQLTTTGQFTFVYDDRFGTALAQDLFGNSLVGWSEGGGAVDPGETDITSLFGSGGTAGFSFYEFFDVAAPEQVDLTNGAGSLSSVSATPFGPDYLVSTTAQGAGLASVERGRDACSFAPFGLVFARGVGGGYAVTRGGSFDADFTSGTELGITDETADALSLPFPFTMPGGGVVGTVMISDNGRVADPAFPAPDFTPSVADALSGVPIICPLWVDLDSGRGSVWVRTTPNFVSITWQDVPPWQSPFGPITFPPDEMNTFQVKLMSNDNIQFHYRDLSLDALSSAAFVGISPGGGVADPDGPTDLRTGLVVSGDDVVYDFFSTGTFPYDDLPDDSVVLSAANLPRLGLPFDCVVDDPSGATVASLFLAGVPSGIFSPVLSLEPIDPLLRGCDLLTDIVSLPPIAIAGVNGAPVTILTIPAVPALAGASLQVSAIAVDPVGSPTLVPTNEIFATFGI